MKVGIIKRILCICLVFLLSINIFAAIVSDNDGAAFITKAEFDALKNDFQSQIDSYNTSIDNKIDGAIASYLAGIQLSTQFELQNIYAIYAINGGTGKLRWRSGTGYNLTTDSKHPVSYFFDVGFCNYSKYLMMTRVTSNLNKNRYYYRDGKIQGSGGIKLLVNAKATYGSTAGQTSNMYAPLYGDNNAGPAKNEQWATVQCLKTRFRSDADYYMTFNLRTSGQRWCWINATLDDSVDTDASTFVLAPESNTSNEQVWNFDTNTVTWNQCSVNDASKEFSFPSASTGLPSTLLNIWGGNYHVWSSSWSFTDGIGNSRTYTNYIANTASEVNANIYGVNTEGHAYNHSGIGVSIPTKPYVTGCTKSMHIEDFEVAPLQNVCAANGAINKGVVIAQNTNSNGKVNIKFNVNTAGYVMLWSSPTGDINWGPDGRTTSNKTAYKKTINRVTGSGTYTRSDIVCAKNDYLWCIFIPDSNIEGNITFQSILLKVDT